MNITPHLGIGDLLILKMIQISNNLNISNININNNLIIKYCENYATKMNFITLFIEFLFPNAKYCINDNTIDFLNITNKYKIRSTYIYDSINNSRIINFKNKYSDYIIFHTKMRHDTLIDKFNKEILSDLNLFLRNFKTTKTILILGERNIGQNEETKLHKTFSLYNNLLLLRQNNDIIDLTNDVLTCGNTEFDNFLSEVEIINKSLCNITFGIGGPFNICKAFSKNNISFIPFYKLSPYKTTLNDFNAIDDTIVQNVHELKSRLDKITL